MRTLCFRTSDLEDGENINLHWGKPLCMWEFLRRTAQGQGRLGFTRMITLRIKPVPRRVGGWNEDWQGIGTGRDCMGTQAWG